MAGTDSNPLSWEPLAVVAGARTPFAKSFGALSKVPADELGRLAVAAALDRAGLTAGQVDELVVGNVAGQADASNVARVIALRAGVPNDRIAHTVNRNCASGMEAVVAGWQAIRDGRSEVVVAGGTESMTNVPLLWDRRMAEMLLAAGRARGLWERARAFLRFRPGYLKPIPALKLGLTDPVCGLNMGQTAEVLAREFNIGREEQDRFALASHQKALAAWERCFLGDEVVAVPAEMTGGKAFERDNGPRAGQSLEQLAKLKPIFEPSGGTVTAGNSCPVTDGAAALVLTSPERARQSSGDRNGEPLGYVRAYAVAGCDPRRMGLGPVYAIHRLLSETGLTLKDIDLIEINEAFAVQVLACVQAMASEKFAREELKASGPVGEIDPERLNVNGGAIALGHPVGTSGARLILTLLRALREKNLRRGIAALCVGGGQGMAVLVETEVE
jgi:acetyl-CoA C-acetyltransferase/acetyl-CoA acyltransferase